MSLTMTAIDMPLRSFIAQRKLALKPISKHEQRSGRFGDEIQI
jgi:hypothetical protein